MTKYLIVFLVIVLIILFALVFFSSKKTTNNHASPTPTIISFPTSSPTPTSIPTTQQQIDEQSKADKNFGQWEQQTKQDYPWLDKLPLQTDNYFVYFDLDLKKFVGTLHPTQSSATPIDQQSENFKKEIMTKLTSLGIDTTKYEFQWTVTPK